MFYWVYDIPSWAFCLLVVGVCVLFAVGGLVLTRPLVRRIVGPPPGINDIVGNIVQAAGAFYGITLGLIAVGAWQTHGDTDMRVLHEAASLGSLYRDVSTFSEPQRSELRALLKKYADFLIDKSWPAQRHGQLALGANEFLLQVQDILTTSEPTSEIQKITLQEAFTQYNELAAARRMRLQAVTGGMPGMIWFVVFAGAASSLMMTWLLVCERQWAERLIVTLLAVLVGLIIFLTAAMDNPFRGEFSVGPDAFISVRDQLMK
jgi:Protein of unknown function (DUF4239)